MKTPEELLYTKSHEWLSVKDGKAKVGLTDHAQEALGDLVFVNLPEVGDTVAAGDQLCDVESIKAVSWVYAPVGGTVSAVNEALSDEPGLVNEDPYGSWFVEFENITIPEGLMTADEYENFVANENEG